MEFLPRTFVWLNERQIRVAIHRVARYGPDIMPSGTNSFRRGFEREILPGFLLIPRNLEHPAWPRRDINYGVL